MTQLFTAGDAWLGGFYELVLELPDDAEITTTRALDHLWAHPALKGVFFRNDVEPTQQPRATSLATKLDGHCFGVATLPNQRQSCCGSFWANYGEGGSWVTFYMPLGSLGKAYPVGGYPFYRTGEPSPEPWLALVNDWLRDIATSIYPQVLFRLAIIGYEVEAVAIKSKLAKGLPANEWDGLLVPSDYRMEWYPPKTYKPPFTLE